MLWRRISRKHRDSSFIAEVFVFESSLSCSSVLETCVMPVFLYKSENWIMTDDLVAKLEAFQAELVKRILKCMVQTLAAAVLTALEVPTLRCRVLERKLGFLRQVIAERVLVLACR